MDRTTLNALQGAAGASGGDKVYVEEVFSTYAYEGTGSSLQINNGIDLDGEGGMVWLKYRNATEPGQILDTVRGKTKDLRPDSTADEGTNTDRISAWNADGFTLSTNSVVNTNGGKHVSWSFRKAPGFFDVVTYEGTGSAQTISHSLASVPGMIVVKRTDVADDWAVWHRSMGANKFGLLNDTDDFSSTSDIMWNSTEPTSNQFSVGYSSRVNTDEGNYVAYIFAHDDQQFGDDGDESIIKCGSFTTNGSSEATIDLGWEPDWLMYKRSDGSSENWQILDNIRGFGYATSSCIELYANTTGIEQTNNGTKPTSSGFFLDAGHSNNATYIYVAIRRGPMKTPEDATKVFAIDARGGTSPNPPTYTSGFPVDLFLQKYAAAGDWGLRTRVTTANTAMTPNDNVVEFSSTVTKVTFDRMDGVGTNTAADSTDYGWMFKRAPGFFDVVAYNGTGSIHTEAHNLGVVPEMMIFKCRDQQENWAVYHKDLTSAGTHVLLNTPGIEDTNSSTWNSTDPTASVFTVGADNYSNGPTETYVAYLFATCPGVSKVGGYTGTGSDINVDCGFTAGARFVLIKRTDSTADWFLYDTTRGIISGNDPYIKLNQDEAEVTSTDYIDPLNAGFIANANDADINTSGGEYIYLAIA